MIQLEFKNSPRHAFSSAERSVIRRICDRVEVEVRELLPTLPVAIRLGVVDGCAVIPEYGSVGCALGSSLVRWTVDAAHPQGVIAIAQARLRAMLFHELHHVTRGWVKAARPATLLQAVVSEGLATAFERDAAGHRAPWGDYPAHVQQWVDELLALPDDTPRRPWLFQHADGRRWIGYRAGTFIVDRATARTRRSAAQLVHTSAAEILAVAFPFG